MAGLFLGWMVERFGGVRPSILAHVPNNATFVTFASFGTAGQPPRSVEIAGIVIGSVVWVGSVAVLRSSRAVSDGS